jgi:hypothetical protein
LLGSKRITPERIRSAYGYLKTRADNATGLEELEQVKSQNEAVLIRLQDCKTRNGRLYPRNSTNV